MNPMAMMGGGAFGQQNEGTNLLSISISILFGFVGGLMFFFGPMEVIKYGSKLAEDIMAAVGFGGQMAQFGFVTTAAPYVILAPIAGVALSQLAGVNSIKKFLYFAVAIIAGLVVAYLTKDYFSTLIGK